MITKRKFPAAIIATVMALLLMPAFYGVAKALDGFVPGADCKLVVQLPEKSTTERDLPGIENAKVPVSVYKLASLQIPEGSTSSEPKYIPEAGFENVFEGVQLPDGALKYSDYSRTLIDGVVDNAQAALAKGGSASGVQPIGEGTVIGRNPLTISSKLKAGLYLVIPEPVVKNGAYQYEFNPSIVSLPTIEDSKGGTPYYSYLTTVNLKVEATDRKGSIEIEKSVLTFNQALGMQTFEFRVKAKALEDLISHKKGEVFEIGIYSIDFSEAGKQSLVVDNIPINCEVTVTEEYTGAAYKLVSDKNQKVTLTPTNTEGKVSFVNDYDGDNPNPGYGIDNKYVHINGRGWDVHPSNEPAASEEQ